jgi:ATP/maltotriose-dependent transcriptional regulator MalT/DNA-binding SARP family transcriptional activator
MDQSSGDISKITIPLLPPGLNRPRLLNLLESNKEKKVILILGQAAQGKTTLAASFVKMSTLRTAWMNLDSAESDPVNLLYLMGQSLQHVFSEIDLSNFLSFPTGRSGPVSEIAFFREWARLLFELVPVPAQIIMDGLDRLSPDAPAFKLIRILIEEARSHIHLILLSREMPPLSLEIQKLNAKQEAFLITNEELAFTLNETKDYFRKVQKISLDLDQLKTAYSLTEGWIGGLIILSESIKRFSSFPRKKMIPVDFPEHFKKEVFQYFGEEIFSSQPQEVQQFLTKSAILDTIEAGFIQDLFGGLKTEEILREFSRKNLFVQSIYDTRKGWLFRYHQLFRDYLKARFDREIEPEERRFYLRKVATLYKQQGDLERSARFFLEAEDYSQAESLIEQAGMDLLRMGRNTDLTLWITSLPNEMVQGNPWLLYYLAMARRFTDVKENIGSLWKALNLFKDRGMVNGQMLAMAYLIENVIHIGHYHSIPVGQLIKDGKAILESLKSEAYPYERAVLWLQIGLGQIRVEENVHDGVSACETAYLIALQLKDVPLQANALIFSIFGLAYLGEFSLADENYEKLDKLTQRMVNPELRAIQLYAHVILSTNRGDFKKATEVLSVFKDFIEKYGFIYLYARVLYYRCLVKVNLEEFLEAEEMARSLLNQATSMEGPFFKGLAYGVFALSHYYQGQYEKAYEFVRQAIETLSSGETKTEIHLHWHKQLKGLICYHLHEDQAAEQEIEETLTYFTRNLVYVSVAGSHLAMALLRFRQGGKELAANHLRIGFEIAEKKKYEHFIFLSPKDLLEACILALKLKVPGAIDYASRLISTRLSPLAEADLKKLSSQRTPEIRERALEIRRTIHRAKIPQLQIRTLGGFLVYRGTHLMEEKDWERNLSRQLLMAIASYGTQKISKHLLVDDLWPDANWASGATNLKVTLHRLRKSLEGTSQGEFKSPYIHLHDNYVFLDQELCQVDVDQFLSLIQKGEEDEKAGNDKQALLSYGEAVDLYRGGFLPEVSDASWADRRRDEFRQKYIALLFSMARLYEKQGFFKKAISCYDKAIQIDPLIEESYQKLMALYSIVGMPNEALRSYEACKKALKDGLETTPDSTTTALYKKIKEKSLAE